jgi:hypothetical protein
MDRNGKKSKAAPSPDAQHAERSDTKSHARETLGRIAADSRAPGANGGGGTEGRRAPGGRKGQQ